LWLLTLGCVADCRQDDHGGGSGPGRQDQLRGVQEDGGEHRRVYEHDFGYARLFSSSLPFSRPDLLTAVSSQINSSGSNSDTRGISSPALQSFEFVLGTGFITAWKLRKKRNEKTSKNEKTSASSRRASLKLAIGSMAREQFPLHCPPHEDLQVRCSREIHELPYDAKRVRKRQKMHQSSYTGGRIRSRQHTRARAPALTRNYRRRQERDKRKTSRVSVPGEMHQNSLFHLLLSPPTLLRKPVTAA
jgi:hypothetical protein